MFRFRSGWRLPTLVELETSLVDTGRASTPYIVGGTGGGNLFNNIQSSWYWTNTKYSSTRAYFVYFSGGNSNDGADTSSGYVLCVKEDDNYQDIWEEIQKFVYEGGTGQERIVGEFTADAANCGGAGTMYDNITNLCWEKSPSTGTFNWPNAVNRCDGLATAGGGWRLPEKAELITLLFHNGASTTYTKLNSISFTGIQNNYYWTNTKYSPNPGTYVYAVFFDIGHSYSVDVTSSYYVLCVKTA